MVLVGWIVGIAAILAGLKLLILWAEPRMAFYPSRGSTPPPTGFERIRLTTQDGVALSGWKSPIPDTGPVFLYFCGNAGNLSNRLELLSRAVTYGIPVIAVDYRGTGESEGCASEGGVYKDAMASYRYATDTLHIAPGRLILWGHSIGGAVAAQLASQVPSAGLILESTFLSAPAMARRMFSGLPVHWLMSYRFGNDAVLPQLRVPTLFIHGSDDRTVPVEDSKRLSHICKSSCGVWIVNGASHNDVYEVAGDEFFERILDFGQGVVEPKTAVPSIP